MMIEDRQDGIGCVATNIRKGRKKPLSSTLTSQTRGQKRNLKEGKRQRQRGSGREEGSKRGLSKSLGSGCPETLPCSQWGYMAMQSRRGGGDCYPLCEIQDDGISHAMATQSSLRLVEHDITNKAFKNQPEVKASRMLLARKKD